MNLQHRIQLLVRLGEYILSDDIEWLETKEKASYENGWFIPPFVDYASENIAKAYLTETVLTNWATAYAIPPVNQRPLKVGIVMAGNLPLVGFHDFLCVFISGHIAVMKPSTRDQVLIKHLIRKLTDWDGMVAELCFFGDMLKGCDAYIATGSNNSSRYFEYYFAKFSNIIRRNRTSVAILTGDETPQELSLLADDVYLYFGLGCRNVTKIYVPVNYDFVPLLDAFRKYHFLSDHHKFKNNYDYNLALHLLNKVYYMTNDAILLIENEAVFSPISQLNYAYYTDLEEVRAGLSANPDIQCVVGAGAVLFGQSQHPSISDYADGIDTMNFVTRL